MRLRRFFEDDSGFVAAPPPRMPVRLLVAGPTATNPPRITWATRTSAYVKWGKKYFSPEPKMYEHRPPARMNSPHQFFYTFRDQDLNVIDLTDYTVVYFTVKRQDDNYESFEATFDGSKTLGKVKFATYSFTHEGLYNVQFVVADSVGQKRWGDPAQVTVVKNVDDLTTSELMNF